jgi:hypothetical protein
MNVARHLPNLTFVAAVAAIVALMVLAFAGVGHTAARVVNVPAGTDLDAKINADPSTTATIFQLDANATYQVNRMITLKAGDGIRGAEGSTSMRGPATDPNPTSKIVGVNGVQTVIRTEGANIEISWVDVSGGNYTGTYSSGYGIRAARGGETLLIQYSRIHHNEAAGITNARGHILDNEIDNNATDPNSVDRTAGGVKGMYEYEAARNFVHDNHGVGMRCDWGCLDTAIGVWNAHHNLVVNNGLDGIRFDHTASNEGEAEIWANEVHGNGYGGPGRAGIHVNNASHALIHNNVAGAASVAGTAYGGNANRYAIFLTQNNPDWPPTTYVTVENNWLNGERVYIAPNVNMSTIVVRNNTP